MVSHHADPRYTGYDVSLMRHGGSSVRASRGPREPDRGWNERSDGSRSVEGWHAGARNVPADETGALSRLHHPHRQWVRGAAADSADERPRLHLLAMLRVNSSPNGQARSRPNWARRSDTLVTSHR